ncbi:Imm26 family immunity protein [Methylorubrum sp. Q1]|uniref:Imm26 family immunity protein n=1 Tax=Methylorubrum sp. Q1 TaxID=2562453 RepID=UPI00187D58FC|nr:Imm26 family immunity protein [Methylorubrum sp. Q1]
MKNMRPDGSVFLVPLRNGGFARGVIAGSSRKNNLIVSYFFGPKYETEKNVDILGMSPEKAVISMRSSDIKINNGSWPVIGQLSNWNSDDWPTTKAVRRDPKGFSKPLLVTYDRADPFKIIGEEILDADLNLPSSGEAGCGFVEIKLTDLLST